jgi:AcrR family transcriptional regulator
MPSSDSSANGSSRSARRRAQTSARMVEAARTLFAQKGVDGTAISEITETADVGFGSFYNHFASKEEIAGAVLEHDANELGNRIDAMTAALDDPAMVIAVAVTKVLRKVRDDPVWGWFLVRASGAVPEMRDSLGSRMNRDIATGMRSGRFRAPNEAMAAELAGLATLSAMRMILEGRAPQNADQGAVEVTLRILGLDPDAADEVVRQAPALLHRLERAAAREEATSAPATSR